MQQLLIFTINGIIIRCGIIYQDLVDFYSFLSIGFCWIIIWVTVGKIFYLCIVLSMRWKPNITRWKPSYYTLYFINFRRLEIWFFDSSHDTVQIIGSIESSCFRTFIYGFDKAANTAYCYNSKHQKIAARNKTTSTKSLEWIFSTFSFIRSLFTIYNSFLLHKRLIDISMPQLRFQEFDSLITFLKSLF